MQIEMIAVDLFDMSGLRIYRGARIKLEKGQSAEKTIFLIIKEIRNIMQLSDKTSKKILAVGVTLPGIVDYKNGIVHKIASLKYWKEVPLKELFEAELKIPAYIYCDIKSHLAYLKWTDIVDETGNATYLYIGDGVGGAVMIDGVIYHGEHGLAGEIGHITMDINGAVCSCGNRGCLEVYASNTAILKYYAEELVKAGRDNSDVLAMIGHRNEENGFIPVLARRALEGDEQADLAFGKATRYITVCLSNMINMYDSPLLILECKWMREARKYFNEAVSGVFETNELITRNEVKILLNPMEEISRVSTYMVVIDKLFTDLYDNILID